MSKYEKTAIDGVYIINPVLHGDERGYFYESFNRAEFLMETDIDFNPVQDNESFSIQGVLRGLHFQRAPHAQAKLVRCVVGEVFDVAVDLRPNSKTYGKYVSVVLSAENHKQFFIPKGFAHGFYVMSDHAVFQYKCDDFYYPELEDGIAWFDQDINVKWPIPDRFLPYLSKKDINRQTLKDYGTRN